MPLEPDLEPAPDDFRSLFDTQALVHLDEIVLNWQTGGHPIKWIESSGKFQVWLENGCMTLFTLYAPSKGSRGGIEIDINKTTTDGFPYELVLKLKEELSVIGRITHNPHETIRVPLGKFSRGDRKVFMAYALTIARHLAQPPEIL